MGFSLLPRNDRFFDLFSVSALNIRRGADELLALLEDFTAPAARVSRLKEIESEGDTITHNIIEYLNASFITPFDREDIYALAGNLDTVLDEIEGVASRIHLFGVDKPTSECVELARIIVRAAQLIEDAIRNLRHFSGLKEFLIAIHDLENQADQITRRETARLFHDGSIPVLELIKWKEIYARLEHTADRMEDVADVIEDIVVKNT